MSTPPRVWGETFYHACVQKRPGCSYCCMLPVLALCLLRFPVVRVKSLSFARYSVATSLDSGTTGPNTLWRKAIKWQQENWPLVLAGATTVSSIAAGSKIRLNNRHTIGISFLIDLTVVVSAAWYLTVTYKDNERRHDLNEIKNELLKKETDVKQELLKKDMEMQKKDMEVAMWKAEANFMASKVRTNPRCKM